MKYDVAVITINYNSSEHTLNCVRRVLAQTSSNVKLQIIVVDNASRSDQYRQLEPLRHLPHVTVVRSRINLGYAAGNMYGLQHANSRYYFFLNNDCLLQNDCISVMVNFCEQTPHVGACSPQLCDASGQPLPSFDYFPAILSKYLGKGIFRLTKGRNYIARGQVLRDPTPVDVLSGSQLFFPAMAFSRVGGFDTHFFLYCEEEDIAMRLYRLGYVCYVVPQAQNFHVGGASTVKSLAIRKEFIISFLYFYRKHYGVLRTQLLKFWLMLRYLKKSLSDMSNLAVVSLIIRGAHFKHSLRHQQVWLGDDDA